mmetsp:Transcript_10895/g.20532  ORF Transcript_10895/g.20532 Transcript_10895/m.20532 type:complete len:228 (+) Transcript_10895:68-751(+)
MGQTICAESICQPAKAGTDHEVTYSQDAVTSVEKVQNSRPKDSTSSLTAELPRLLGAKEDSKSADKSSPNKDDEGLGGVDLEGGEDVVPSADPLDTGRQSKAQRKFERAEARKQVLPFLLQNGFHTVKSKKTFLWKSWYPLHTAVKQKDLETLRVLLTAGADPQKLNSRGETPQELAERLNRSGSHCEIIDALSHVKVKKRKSCKAQGSVKGKSSTASSLEITPRGV